MRWRRDSRPKPPAAAAWADSIQAVTLALVNGDRVRFVLETLGAVLETERTATFDEAEAQQDYEAFAFAVQVESIDGWTLIVEPNGYLASLPDNVVALSRGGRVVSVYWNVNAQMRFQYAVDGSLVRSFDPLLPELGPEGIPLPEETGLPFGVDGEDARAASVALAERLTGVRVDVTTLTGTTRSTWTVPGDA